MKALTPFRAMRLPLVKKQLAWSRLARRLQGYGVSFRDSKGCFVLISPSTTTAYPWRVTWFFIGKDGSQEPGGHVYAKTHRDAVNEARLYGAVLESAKISTVVPREVNRRAAFAV